MKGIVIGSSTEGGSSSSSKPKPSKDEDKWKGILIKKSMEERKAEIEAEMEKKKTYSKHYETS